MNGTFVNHMLHAGGICIISLSSAKFIRPLMHGLIFDAKKSMCIHFSTTMNKHCGLPVTYQENSVY